MLTFRKRSRGRVDWDHDHFVVTITALRPHSSETATVELSEAEWRALPPVRQAVTQELERLKLPVRADIAVTDSKAFPTGRNDVRDGRPWVVLTARCAGVGDVAVIEMPGRSGWRLRPFSG